MKRKLQRLTWLKSAIQESRDWIKSCDENGVSYSDETPSTLMPGLSRGEAIRRADTDYLEQMEQEYLELGGPEHK